MPPNGLTVYGPVQQQLPDHSARAPDRTGEIATERIADGRARLVIECRLTIAP
jgi:hypothetical protein